MSDKGIMDMGDSHNAALSKSWAQPGSGSIVGSAVQSHSVQYGCCQPVLERAVGQTETRGQQAGLSKTATEPEPNRSQHYRVECAGLSCWPQIIDTNQVSRATAVHNSNGYLHTPYGYSLQSDLTSCRDQAVLDWAGLGCAVGWAGLGCRLVIT